LKYDVALFCSCRNFVLIFIQHHLDFQSIIYRDIKPENIGFDIRDDVKIFDFGLAAELQPALRVPGRNTYNLTRETGSPRYMAPEVALGQPYNQKADVYSFGLLLWEICELKVAYDGHGFDSLTACVFEGNERPPITPKKWNQTLTDLMKNTWSRRIERRLECEDIMTILKAEVGTMYDDDENILKSLDVSSRTDQSIIARRSR
jgi:serine/threonine protein kinase